MRILFATSIARFADLFLGEVARQAMHRGWEVDLATNMDAAAPLDRPYRRILDVSWGRGFSHPGGDLAAARDVRGLLRNGAYDIVHTHTPTASAIVRSASRTVRHKPVVFYTAHGFSFGKGLDSAEHRVALGLERAMLDWSEVLIVLNADDFRWARAHRRADRATLLSRGVGIKEEFLHPPGADRVTLRRSLGLADNEFLIVNVGEMWARKRQDLAIAAVAAMHRVPRHLVIVGEGPLHSELEARARATAMRDTSLRITFTDHVDNVHEYLAVADAMVHTAEREGLPTAVIEAMALGCPVVGVDIRGVSDLLQQGGGVLVAEAAPQPLARALDDLRRHPDAAAALGRGGMTAARRYDRRVLAAEQCDWYELFGRLSG